VVRLAAIGEVGELNNPYNVRIIDIHKLEQIGASSTTALRPPKPTDRVFIIYTSGTTGDPKGVVHSHQAFVANVGSGLRNLALRSDEIHFAFLPMAHIMEQFIEAMVLALGSAIGFWGQNLRNLSVCGWHRQ
jgi:long-chain acyl-CoA synthetase